MKPGLGRLEMISSEMGLVRIVGRPVVEVVVPVVYTVVPTVRAGDTTGTASGSPTPAGREATTEEAVDTEEGDGNGE